MATQYNLQLKAVLDTSQVKQQLDQLKKQAADMNSSPSAAGPSSSIAGVLRSLNLTLQNLQRSIDRLVGMQRTGASSSTRNTMPPFVPGRGYTPLKNAKPQQLVKPSNTNQWLKGWLQTPQYMSINKRTNRVFERMHNRSDLSDVEYNVMRFRYGHKDNPKFAHNLLKQNGARGILQAFGAKPGQNYYDYVGEIRKKYLNNLIPADSKARIANNQVLNEAKTPKSTGMFEMNSRQQRYVTKQLGIMGTGIVLGGLADVAEAKGNTKTAKTLNVVSQIGQGAAMGGLIGGPAGFAIGAATGGLTAAFQHLAESARETAAALADQKKAILAGQDTDNQVHKWLQERADKEAAQKGDVGYFQNELKKEQGFANEVKSKLENGPIGFGGEGKTGAGGVKLTKFNLREYEKETARLMEEKGSDAKDDPEIKKRQDTVKLYKANVAALMEHQERADKMKAMAEQLKQQKEQENKQPADVAKTEKIATEKAGGQAPGELAPGELYIDDAKRVWRDKASRMHTRWSVLDSGETTLKERLQGMTAPDMNNVNSLASQGFMISKSDDDARMQQQNDYLRDIASITREIKNIESQKEGAVYA